MDVLDVLQPPYGIGMHQAVALLLVPDIDLVVPQDGYFLIFHHLHWIILVPVLCIHFDTIVLAYVQM